MTAAAILAALCSLTPRTAVDHLALHLAKLRAIESSRVGWPREVAS